MPFAPRSPTMPVLATLFAIGLFSLMDALMKRASIFVGVYPALLCRSVIAAAVLAPLWRLRGGTWPEPWPLRLHLLRGLVVAGMAASFFWGLVRVPMAEAIALAFVSPLIALWLASARLGERIRRESVIAGGLGLAGVIVIGAGRFGTGDAHGASGIGMAAILLSATLYAWNLVLQRQQALVAHPVEVALFQNGVIALAMLPLAPLWWLTPRPETLGDITAAAGLVSASLVLLSWAYARAEAQVLVPLEYSAFAWAALMGWLWFDEEVTLPTMVGTVLIAAGCFYGTRSNAQDIHHAST